MDDRSMKEIAIAGIGWRSTSTIIQFVLSIVLTIVFMQYISPEGYGIIAKLLIILGLVNIFLDLGYSQSIVQQKSEDSESLSTHFYWILAVSIALAVILYALSSQISTVYIQEELNLLLKLFCITVILGGSTIVHRALLHRRMEFKRLALIELSSFLLSGVLGLYLALNGFDYMAVVYQLLCASVLQFIFFWANRHFLPKLKFVWSRLRATRGFSAFIFISMITDYAVQLLDQFLISVYYPAAVLGHYNRASSLVKTPVSLVPGTISQVLFPLFSGMQNTAKVESKRSISSIYLRSHGIIVLFFVPVFITCFVFADSIVAVLFTDSWLPMIPYFRTLSLIACVSVTMIEGAVVLSYGDADRFFYVSLPGKLIIILSLIVGVFFGIEVMLWGLLVGTVVSKILYLTALHRFFSVDFSAFRESIMPVSVPIFANILLLVIIRFSTESPWIHLSLSIAVHVVVTLVFYRFGKGYVIESFRKLISSLKE